MTKIPCAQCGRHFYRSGPTLGNMDMCNYIWCQIGETTETLPCECVRDTEKCQPTQDNRSWIKKQKQNDTTGSDILTISIIVTLVVFCLPLILIFLSLIFMLPFMLVRG